MPEYTFDHIHLRSMDPVKTAEFYRKMFGAKIIATRTDAGRTTVNMDLKGVTVLINQPPAGDTQTGLVHFGIRTDNLEESVADFKKKGVKFTQEIRQVRPNFKMSFMTAPEDVPIELQQGQF
jgi:lactoylglutathione lyase